MKKGQVEFEVRGRKYLAWVQAESEQSYAFGVNSSQDDWVIGEVIGFFWQRDGKHLLESLDTKSGQMVDDVAYSFYEDGFSEVPKGEVCLSLFENEIMVTEELFERFVIESALAFLDAMKNIGLPAREELRPVLEARRASLSQRSVGC